jgi:acyl carrier protein|tara:strand:+ start:658 stop:798 length:141 start_codon:yes stop_codon:yes gene_type:complete
MNEELKEQIRELIIEVLEEREKDERDYQRAFDDMMMKDVPPFPSIN